MVLAVAWSMPEIIEMEVAGVVSRHPNNYTANGNPNAEIMVLPVLTFIWLQSAYLVSLCACTRISDMF